MQKLFVIFLLLTFGLTACKTEAPGPTTAPVMATEVPSPVPPSPTVMVDHCVSCHTDKEQLISTAKPVEAVESESKGVG